MKDKKLKYYRVYIQQINQTYVEVNAFDDIEAMAKAKEKWRKECAIPHVVWVDETTKPRPEQNEL